MRVLKTDLKNQRVVLRPESPTDLYVLSNLIQVGDQIIGKTNRRVRRMGSEGRSGEESQRITVVVTIEVEDMAFQDSVVSNRLRVKGKIIQGPEQHVSIGSYHTLNIDLTQMITLIKPEWTKYYLQLLKEAEEASRKPKICLIAIDQTDVCIGLLDNYRLTVVAQEKSHIARKLAKDKIRTKQTQSFFDLIFGVIQRQIIPETKNIVVGGPGFIKERLVEVLREKFKKEDLNVVIAGSLSGGNRVGLQELLRMEAIDKLAQDFRVLADQRLIEEFLKRLNQGRTDITYGLQAVEEVAVSGAIETVVLVDTLIRSVSELERERVATLLREIESMRGRIVIVSAQSDEAQKIKTFGGIFALLRYALSYD